MFSLCSYKAITSCWASYRSHYNQLQKLLCHTAYSWLCITEVQFLVDSRFAFRQWETTLLCNDVSYWLGASLESILLLKLGQFSPKYSQYTPLACQWGWGMGCCSWVQSLIFSITVIAVLIMMYCITLQRLPIVCAHNAYQMLRLSTKLVWENV